MIIEIWASNFKQCRSDDCSDALKDDISDTLDESDFPPKEESGCDGRIDMTSGNVTDALRDGGDRHTEGKGDSDEVNWPNSAGIFLKV